MLRVAIVGTGAIADSHLQAYLKWSAEARVVALVDLFPEKARAKAERFGLSVPVFQDCAALLAGAEFDVASVCLPPFEHAAATIALLEAGKHVLTEKPMATCLEECDAMLAAARSSGRLLGVVAQNRYKTPIARLKRLLDAGLIGRVLHAQVDSLWWRGASYYDLWWRGTWAQEGGGCTLNHAVHHLDLFQWLMGMPDEVLSVSLNLAHENSEVEDFSASILTYNDGRVGQITASLVHHGEEQRLVFQGERAKVAVPWEVQAMRARANGFPEDHSELAAEIQAFYDSTPGVEHEGHDGQIANFLRAVVGREPLLVDGLQGRRTLELVTAIYQSGHLGQRVHLPLPPDAPFYTRAGLLRHARHFHEKTRSIENFATNNITLGRNLGR
ncbi:MAG: Gfo/Idh/MocA family oxidoreductase [Verrucomicrobia bacterium]|nr:Gfo/Idh/MocA family oxidoreductase [Verrucomicrobiota bacterium]